VLEHVADDHHLLAQAVDVLPRGGHVLITVPADPSLWSEHDRLFGHFRRYDRTTLGSTWAALPVEVRMLESFNTRLYPLIAARRRLFPEAAGAGGDLDIPVGPVNGLLHRILASESHHLLAALDRPSTRHPRGVSLVAVLRRLE
jgi:hypothetical protein